MANTVVQRNITAQNQFSDAVRIADRKFSVSIRSSAISATITLQRKLPGEPDANYRDVESWTANAEKIGESVGSWDYRIGCKTGNFSSATALNAAIVF
jgi:hypothetical protein